MTDEEIKNELSYLFSKEVLKYMLEKNAISDQEFSEFDKLNAKSFNINYMELL